MMYYNYMFSPFMFLGPIISILIWVLIIMLIVRLIRGSKHGDWRKMWGSGAIDVLRERYAKGEISKEEYEERKKVLEEK